MSRLLFAGRPGTRFAPFRHASKLVAAAAFAAATAFAPASVSAQDPPPPPPGVEEDPNEEVLPVTSSDDGILLTALIKHASELTHRTFIYPPEFKPNPQQKIILTNVLPVPRRELFNVYKAMLKAHNFALVPIGPADARMFLVATLQSATAKALIPTAPFVDANDLEKWKDSTELIRTVIPLRYTDISKAKTDLASLVNQSYGAINTIQSVNALIITEFAPTVYAVHQMLKVMDQKQAEAQLQFKKIPLRHAVAEELEPILGELLSTEGGGGGSGAFGGAARPRPGTGGEPSVLAAPEAKIITEPRTNSLIVYAIREDMEKIESLVAQLDQEIEGEEGKVHIYQLQHAIAEDVEETLSELLQGSTGGGISRGRRSGQRGIGDAGSPGGGSPVVGSTLQEADIIIVAEKHTNSLLIQASKTQYGTLKTIIDAIDVRLPQVLIEAAVVELTENFGDVFGVELGYAGSINGDDVIIGTQNGIAPITVDPDTGTASRDLANIAGTVIGGVFTDGAFSIPILIAAAKTRGNSNLLSLPSVLTNNNQEATITIGSQQPTGTIGSVGSGGSTTQTIGFGGYVDANLTLSISPYISAGDYLRLEINLLVESFGTDQNTQDAVPPPKSTRELSTSITVPDNATIVLGGLKQSDERESESKVPLLGDIPFLGALFRNSMKTKAETTLYLFVSPHIIKERSFGDIRDLTRQKIREMEVLIGDKIQLVDPSLKPRSQEDEADEAAASENDVLLPGVPRYVSPGDLTQPDTLDAQRGTGGGDARGSAPATGTGKK